MKQTWIVQVNRSILGLIVPRARPAKGKYRLHRDLPRYLRQFLNLPDDIYKRPVMADFKNFEELDAAELDDGFTKRRATKYERFLTVVVDVPEIPKTPRYTKADGPLIRNFRGLLKFFGASEPQLLNKRVYQGTECGASISIYLADGTPVHNGNKRWETLTGNEKLRGFTIQTIVEGSVATVDSELFRLPVPVSIIQAWIAEMEAQASDIWERDNQESISE